MIPEVQLHDIATRATAKPLRGFVEHIKVEPSSDMDGRDALRLTIHLREGALDAIEDDSFIDVLVNLRDSLNEAGETRGTTVQYVVAGIDEGGRDN